MKCNVVNKMSIEINETERGILNKAVDILEDLARNLDEECSYETEVEFDNANDYDIINALEENLRSICQYV